MKDSDLEKKLDTKDSMELILGMPVRTSHFKDVKEKAKEKRPVVETPSPVIEKPRPKKAANKMLAQIYVNYGRACREKIGDVNEHDMYELAEMIGCGKRELDLILIGGHQLLDEKLYKSINYVLGLKPYELKQKHAKIF